MKKVLTVTLAAAVMLCVSMAAFAASGKAGKITGMTAPLSVGHSSSADLREIFPAAGGHVETIDLLDTMFQWEDGSTGTGQCLSAAQIRENRLAVRTGGSSKAVKDVSIDNSKGRIELTFVDEHVSTKELDFTVDVYLTIDGRRQSDYGITFTGTLANPVLDIYAGDTHADISDGTVAYAAESNSGIELDLGNGVSLSTRLIRDRKYYGVAALSLPEDGALRGQYPEIEMELVLKTVGFGSAADVIRLDGQYAGRFVYDEELNLLGKANEPLPFSHTYYLSARELEVEVDNGESASAPATPSTPDDTPSNANHNPGTGR